MPKILKVWDKIQEVMAVRGHDHPQGCPCFLHDPAAWSHEEVHRFVRGEIDEAVLGTNLKWDRKARQEGRRYT